MKKTKKIKNKIVEHLKEDMKTFDKEKREDKKLIKKIKDVKKNKCK
mgnify:CR=1 FL=1